MCVLCILFLLFSACGFSCSLRTNCTVSQEHPKPTYSFLLLVHQFEFCVESEPFVFFIRFPVEFYTIEHASIDV
jgi:hypothetical protein